MTLTAPEHVHAAGGDLRLGDEAQRQQHGGDPDRHVDVEGPLPRQVLGEDAAEQQADGRAADGDGRPDAQRPRALGALLEGGGHDRQRRRRDHRRAEALQRARSDEELGRGREAVEQRRDGEDDHADDEQALAPDEVGGAAAEQQEAAEGERVCVHDPLQRAGREVEVLLDRGQRHVHDGRVQHDHELGDAHEHQDEPLVGDPRWVRRCSRGGSGGSGCGCGRGGPVRQPRSTGVVGPLRSGGLGRALTEP